MKTHEQRVPFQYWDLKLFSLPKEIWGTTSCMFSVSYLLSEFSFYDCPLPNYACDAWMVSAEFTLEKSPLDVQALEWSLLWFFYVILYSRDGSTLPLSTSSLHPFCVHWLSPPQIPSVICKHLICCVQGIKTHQHSTFAPSQHPESEDKNNNRRQSRWQVLGEVMRKRKGGRVKRGGRGILAVVWTWQRL